MELGQGPEERGGKFGRAGGKVWEREERRGAGLWSPAPPNQRRKVMLAGAPVI